MKRSFLVLFFTLFLFSQLATIATESAFCKSGPSKSTQVSKEVGRDSSGRIKRSPSAKRQFMRDTGHPHGWRGHQVHHKRPLYKGGSDTPRNMQWVTDRQHKQIHSER